jgi:hypothetical protein
MTDQFAGQKVTELILDSGETVYVKPLSILHYHALVMRAEQEYPYPDPNPYEKAIDASKTLEPGEVIPAAQNPAYQTLCKAIDEQRKTFQYRQYILLSVEVVDQKATLERHRERVEKLRAMMVLPDDAWTATLLYSIISSTEDYNRILAATSGQLLVTEEEISNGWRIFRPRIQRPTSVGRGEKSEPQGATASEPIESDAAGQ